MCITIWDTKRELRMNSVDACVESSAAPGRDGLRSGEYLLMWLSCPVTGRTTQSASDGRAQASITRAIPPYFWGGGVSQAKSDQQMQSPCATAIWDEDDIMWKWAKWWRQHGERQKKREGEREKVEPPLRLLKGKVSLLESGEISRWCVLIRNHVPPNTPFTRSKSRAFICWRQPHINYQKVALKNKNLSVQSSYIPIKNTILAETDWHL